MAELQILFWACAAIVALASHRDGRALTRSVRGRLPGLWLGVVATYLGWVGAHLCPIFDAGGGLQGWVASLLAMGVGASVSFLPAGPLFSRGLFAPSGPSLDADLRAMVPAVAVARLGCIAAGCCGGRSLPADSLLALAHAALFKGSLERHPAAGYDILVLMAVAIATRRPGRGGWALIGLGASRAACQWFRAEPPHGGDSDFVYWVSALWIGLGASLLVARLQKSSSSSDASPRPTGRGDPPNTGTPDRSFIAF